MLNPLGRNQWGEKIDVSDEVLKDAFEQYGKENNGSGLTAEEVIARLKADLGYEIKRTKLFELRKRLGITTVRKNNTMPQQRAQAVIDIKENDLAGRWGVNQVHQRLANEGYLVPRDELREVLHDHFNAEFDRRFVGSKDAIARVPLDSLGLWHQFHADGHEKLAAQALEMGDVTLPIYAFKDKFVSVVPLMRVLPNVRLANTIGHLFLDLVYEYKKISLQLVVDKGSEVGEMRRCHECLRLEAAPEFSIEDWPPTVQVQSSHNTPIEGFWHWKRNGEGHSIREAILVGKDRGFFNPNNELHVQVFNWLWPDLVQNRLDEFREYWNNHRLSSQKKKLLPSRTSLLQMWSAPASVQPTARDCSIVVNMETVECLQESLGGWEGREEAFRFVSRTFEAVADNVLEELGFPMVTLSNAWDIFNFVVARLS
ncbi:hypothetical protein JAAARDRAFT_193672 [Jaapia argillacea MUCL 33604]|uniref:Integrase core domain-containing protein n=1 Tax=Jaapia argillacea MUCL 33604 TaxID=933084 RepID=A0A067PWK9_9AGAM|nr:hypothetical protein JAAARDRAFT_193672 [Jaapia argillacea MUCL 33604]